MLSQECVRELESSWLPHITNAGLERLIELLDKGSPMLIHGAFARAGSMGCLASHVAWNHPRTQHMSVDAGINWLYKIAGLNPATSHVLCEWDARRESSWEMRLELLALLREERQQRQERLATADPGLCLPSLETVEHS